MTAQFPPAAPPPSQVPGARQSTETHREGADAAKRWEVRVETGRTARDFGPAVTVWCGDVFVARVGPLDDTERAKANAALIAAAPDMHEALSFVAKFVALRTDRGDQFPSQLTAAVRAALVRAEGR